MKVNQWKNTWAVIRADLHLQERKRKFDLQYNQADNQTSGASNFAESLVDHAAKREQAQQRSKNQKDVNIFKDL